MTLSDKYIPLDRQFANLGDVKDSARWQAMLRNDLLQSAPWVFFAHSDPRSLPAANKAHVLRRTVEHFKGRDHERVDWDRPTLERATMMSVLSSMARHSSTAKRDQRACRSAYEVEEDDLLHERTHPDRAKGIVKMPSLSK